MTCASKMIPSTMALDVISSTNVMMRYTAQPTFFALSNRPDNVETPHTHLLNCSSKPYYQNTP